jgi:hypothetical protein
MIRTGATFADAAAEYLRYIEHDRRRKPSTLDQSLTAFKPGPRTATFRQQPASC